MLIWIIVFPLLLSLLFAGISYGFYLASLRGSSWRRGMDRLSGGRTRQWILNSFAGSVVAQLLVILTYPLGRLRPEHGSVRRKGTPRIILVHGLYHNSSAWLLWKRDLRRRGYTDISCFSYGSFNTSRAVLQERFTSFMRSIRTEAPNRDLVLIGHSLGGLLAATWAASTGDPERIRALVTMGTPFQGSTLARLGMGSLARELMRRENCALPVHPEEEPERRGARLALVSPTDNMVLPPTRLLPPPGWEVQLTAPQGHVTMLYSRETRAMVFAFLERNAPAPGA
jgi:triacylglycerol esterase/lipase EstA (alpha/beta hydrolase family)